MSSFSFCSSTTSGASWVVNKGLPRQESMVVMVHQKEIQALPFSVPPQASWRSDATTQFEE